MSGASVSGTSYLQTQSFVRGGTPHPRCAASARLYRQMLGNTDALTSPVFGRSLRELPRTSHKWSFKPII